MIFMVSRSFKQHNGIQLCLRIWTRRNTSLCSAKAQCLREKINWSVASRAQYGLMSGARRPLLWSQLLTWITTLIICHLLGTAKCGKNYACSSSIPKQWNSRLPAMVRCRSQRPTHVGSCLIHFIPLESLEKAIASMVGQKKKSK